MKSSQSGVPSRLNGKVTRFRLEKLYVLYLLQMVLLLCICIACGVTFGYNVSELSHINNVIYDAETRKLLTSCLILLSYQPVYFGTEAASASANANLISMIGELENRNRVDINFDELYENLDEMFQYGTVNSVDEKFEALKALQTLALQLTYVRSSSTNRNFNPSYIYFIGLDCVAKQLYQSYFYNALLQSSVYPLWNATDYLLYSGFQYNRLTVPDCSEYISVENDLSVLLQGAASLSSTPTFTPQYVQSPLQEADILASLAKLEVEVKQSENTADNYYQKQFMNSSLITFYSLVGMLLCCCFAAFSPLFFTKGLQRHTETLRRYKKLEGNLRFLSVYSSSIATLKDTQLLYHVFFGTFLLKLIGFMGRARPFIPQTAFGDIESIVVSSADNWTIIGNNVSEGGLTHTSEDEHSAQELRTEVGLQLALGTAMCVSIKDFFTYSDPEKVGCALARDMSAAVGLIERVASSHNGVIHSVSFRYIFIVWNVNSSCAHHELEALYTALEIVSLFDGHNDEISICIASSLLVAGTVEESVQRAVMVCGPAMLFCQKTQPLNRYHNTSIVMDKNVASKVFSLNIAGEEYCAVPISLYRVKPNRQDYQVVYGLLNSRLTEPLKAWSNVFKGFPSWLATSSLAEMQAALQEYRKTFLRSTEVYSGSITLSCTVEFWETLLHALQH